MRRSGTVSRFSGGGALEKSSGIASVPDALAPDASASAVETVRKHPHRTSRCRRAAAAAAGPSAEIEELRGGRPGDPDQ